MVQICFLHMNKIIKRKMPCWAINNLEVSCGGDRVLNYILQRYRYDFHVKTIISVYFYSIFCIPKGKVTIKLYLSSLNNK